MSLGKMKDFGGFASLGGNVLIEDLGAGSESALAEAPFAVALECVFGIAATICSYSKVPCERREIGIVELPQYGGWDCVWKWAIASERKDASPQVLARFN